MEQTVINSQPQNPDLTILYKNPFENIVGKGENAGNQHFGLFPQCFQLFPKEISIFLSRFFLSSANAFNLDQSKTLSFSKELAHNYRILSLALHQRTKL